MIVNVTKEDPDIRAVLMSGSWVKLGFTYDEEEEQGIETYMKLVRSGEI